MRFFYILAVIVLVIVVALLRWLVRLIAYSVTLGVLDKGWSTING